MQGFTQFLFSTQRYKVAFWLAASMFISLGLIAIRAEVSGMYHFRFLVWNLFLAFIPYVASLFLSYYTATKRNLLVIAAGVSLWLLFFPNAPYIITDLFHLRPRAGIPYWYDLLLIVSCAWTGLMLGFVSLAEIQSIISSTFNKIAGWGFVVTSLLLCGFGIYLGRFERWNSWDIVTNPTGLAKNIIRPVLDPFGHPKVWMVTIAFAAFLMVGYFTITQLGNIIPSQRKNNE